LAQSSGNFSAQITTAQCVINTLSGENGGALVPGTLITNLSTTIKTPNSTYTTLLIRPSLVTGLFNNTEVTPAMQTSANTAAVRVFVTLDGQPVFPDTGDGVVYDERFQQLSANNFSAISSCAFLNNCSMDLVESTLAAHSFDFVKTNVGGGTHELVMSWLFECYDATGTPTMCTETYAPNTVGACAGPGVITVTQTKAFTQSGGVTMQPQ
jgi:hypothetical protein